MQIMEPLEYICDHEPMACEALADLAIERRLPWLSDATAKCTFASEAD